MNSTNSKVSTQGFSAEEVRRFKQVESDLGGMKRGPVEQIWETVLGLWNLLCNSSATLMDRLSALFALFYLIIPFDLIPDVLPGGLADDVALILATAATLAARLYDFAKKTGKHNS